MAAQMLIVLAVVGFVCCMAFIGGLMGVGWGILSLILFGFSGFLCECAAYDHLVCPHCGQRAVKPHRDFPADRENIARLRAISRGGSFVCAHCGRTVETK